MYVVACETSSLRTVPTFVSAQTFCASRKAWFKSHARAGLTLTQSTTLPSTWLIKMKAEFSYCGQIKFYEPVLTPLTPEQWRIANHSMLTSSAEKLAVIYRKLYWNPTADGVVRAQNKSEIRKCLTYWGGDRKKCNRHRKSFQKRSITWKKRVATPTFYVMKWKWQAYSTRD